MTQEEIQIIIDSDIPSFEKSRLLLQLFDAKNANVKMFQQGGEFPESKDKLIEKLKLEWPALNNIKFDIIADKDYNPGDGFGNIEYIRAELGQVDYGNGIIIKGTPGVGTIYYNPNKADELDIKLDLLHALRELDPKYNELLQNFVKSLDWENNDYIKGELQHNILLSRDGEEQALNNTIDGFLRNLLLPDNESAKSRNYDTIENARNGILTTDDSKWAFEVLKNYITGETTDNPKEKGWKPGLKQQGGTLDMTLEDILKLNISQSAKDELTRAFAEGGHMEEKIPEPDAVVTVGDNEYKVCIADTPEKRKEGLSKCKHLPEDGGMLFIFEEPSTSPFTMAETSINLDIIFLDEEGEVIEVHSVKAMDPNPVECSEEYCYVLEVNYGSGILEGDELSIDSDEFTEDDKNTISRSKMLVLDENGDVLMKLVGGERIMSIISTKKLIKLAIKAFRDENESDYRRVGRFIMNEFNDLDNRQPQYVEAPEKKGLE